MIYGKKNVLQWFDSTNMQYWTLYPLGKTESGNPTMKSDESENATHLSALEDLRNRINWINGRYTIVASAVPKNISKGTYREDFQTSITDEEIIKPPSGTISIGNIPATEDIEKRISERVDAALQKMENESLKEKIKELEKENKSLQDNSPLNKIAGVISPFAPQIISSLFPGTGSLPKVAGLPVNEEVDEDQQRLENVVSILSEIDNDWLQKLEKLAFKVKANPSLWNMVNTFL